MITHRKPVAVLEPARRHRGFPFGTASADPLLGPGDEWRQPMRDREADDWMEER